MALGLAKDGSSCQLMVDHVVAGSGYDIDVERIEFMDRKLRSAIQRLERAPRLESHVRASLSGLHFIGPASANELRPALSLRGRRGIHSRSCFGSFGGASFVRGITDSSSPVIFLPGADGCAPNLDVFRESVDDMTPFEVIGYPQSDCRRLLSGSGIAERGGADSNKGATGTNNNTGDISVMQLRFACQGMGREIAGFCAIDTFMMVSPELSEGWRAAPSRRLRAFTRAAIRRVTAALYDRGSGAFYSDFPVVGCPSLLQRFPSGRRPSVPGF